MTKATSSRWQMRGLQGRVALLVGLGLFASTVVPGWIAWHSLAALTDRIVVERESDAAVAARHVESVLQREWRRLQEVAAAPDAATGRTVAALSPRDEALRNAYLQGELIDRAFVTNADGLVLKQDPPPQPGAEAVIPASRDALKAERPSASAVARTPTGDRVYLFVPIKDWRGVPIGVAGGEIDPASPRMIGLLREQPVAEGGAIDLVDALGIVVASSDAQRRGRRDEHPQLIASLLRSGTNIRGTCTSCHDRSKVGVEQVTAIVPIRQMHWALSLREPETATLADANRLRRSLFFWVPLLVVLGLLFADGVAQSVLRPIGVLRRAAERIASGDLDLAIPPLGEDEVGRLGRSLEHMRAALKASMDAIEQSNATLEARVEERTREREVLYRQLAEREEARGRLLRQVITAQEDERKRLARELHDETCQTVSVLAMRLETAVARLPPGVDSGPLIEARALAVRTLDELHRLIYDLRPSVLDDLGLWSAIAWYADRHLNTLGVAVRCEFNDVERRLPPLMETALFRVVQEAISNIARHAQAEQVLIQCGIRGDVLTIEIEDDGEGFDRAAISRPAEDGHGWGLLGITERVEAIGGKVLIDTAPGQGTRLVVSVQVPPEVARV
ncbi:MAG: HAMP domain-containing protein [Acidobacteria bacterium]|nr:HAMP domain-containing protein [Acidobacteriota bacterium]